jgi:histidine ammonia-lyase
MNNLIITGENLTIEDVVMVANKQVTVSLAESTKQAIIKSRAIVDNLVKENKVVYGITTGFGSLASVSIPQDKVEELQANLIRSHSCGIGNPFSEEIVRAIILLRINTFSKGHSGVRLEVVNFLVSLLNNNIYPYVPEKGSVGSSGDLAPLSHLALLLIGEGEVIDNNKRVPSKEILSRYGILPLTLQAKEGLALNNGTSVMTAIGCINLDLGKKIIKQAQIATALTFEAVRGITSSLDPRLHQARPQIGQGIIANNLRKMLANSKLVNTDPERVQDAYSLRASPVVLGAVYDTISYVESVLTIEINSATDNPLIFSNEAISGANFHGEPIAMVMDFLKISFCEMANISERRIARLVDNNLNSQLPAFLIDDSGVNSGLMIPQYVAAALVSENKVLSHPASVDSIPTCANQEDHVSMGTHGARQAGEILDNAVTVIAIEFLCAAQALEFRESKPSLPLQKVMGVIRGIVPPLDKDRVLSVDIENIKKLLLDGSLFRTVQDSCGQLL